MADVTRERSAREEEMIERVRGFCDRLPEVAVSVDGHTHTVFRVGKKPFVLIGGGKGSGTLSLKADPVTRDMLVRKGPYVRSAWGDRNGYVSAWGEDALDWEEVGELVVDAYRLVAPKRVLAQLET